MLVKKEMYVKLFICIRASVNYSPLTISILIENHLNLDEILIKKIIDHDIFEPRESIKYRQLMISFREKIILFLTKKRQNNSYLSCSPLRSSVSFVQSF
jgi:hypothetical protein